MYMAATENRLSNVTCASVEWQLPDSGAELKLTTNYAVNSSNADMLLVTGFGETYVKRIAEDLGRKGVELAVCNLAYPEGVDLSFEVLESTVINGLGAVISAVNKSAGRYEDHPLKLVGHSKGFGELVKLVDSRPDLCQEFTGAAPLGLNCKAKAFGNTTQERRLEIKRRLKSTGLFDEIGGNFEELKRLAVEFNAGTAYLQEHDVAAIVRRLHQTGKLRHLVIGKNDKLCPPKESSDLVGVEGLILVTEGGHDPLSSDAGLGQIELAISQLAE